MWGSIIGVIKGDTRRLDYCSYRVICGLYSAAIAIVVGGFGQITHMSLSPKPSFVMKLLVHCMFRGIRGFQSFGNRCIFSRITENTRGRSILKTPKRSVISSAYHMQQHEDPQPESVCLYLLLAAICLAL